VPAREQAKPLLGRTAGTGADRHTTKLNTARRAEKWPWQTCGCRPWTQSESHGSVRVEDAAPPFPWQLWHETVAGAGAVPEIHFPLNKSNVSACGALLGARTEVVSGAGSFSGAKL